MAIKIAVIGAGRLGSLLANQLHKESFEIGIFSRSFSFNLNPGIIRHSSIPLSADLYILAVADDNILTAAEQVRDSVKGEPLVIHTSGTFPLKGLDDLFANTGMLYPLNTFDGVHQVDWQNTPVFITYNKDSLLKTTALSLSREVIILQDEKSRVALHTAAVFVSNFTTALYDISFNICNENNISFNHLKPLLEQTAQKMMNTQSRPLHHISGPAIRGDSSSIQKHLQLLEKDEQVKRLYQLITTYIQKQG